MKHRINTKLGRQFGKSLSKTTKFAVRKGVGQAKEHPAARKAPGCPVKNTTRKEAAKVPLDGAEAAPAVLVGGAESRTPHNPLRPHVGPRYVDPLDYAAHPYPSMRRYAEHLALGRTMPRTRHSYYRSLRLIQEYFNADPATLTEDQFRGYILYVKTKKQWEPKTIRQTAACAKLFFVEMLGHQEWTVFSQIRTKDHQKLPAVLTREEVCQLLKHIRLRRYRTPIKLIYCCGLRISECLGLTIHDIDAAGGKLWIRKGKGDKDRMVPLAESMVEDLRRYWAKHRHPLLLFPHAGRGHVAPDKVAGRMGKADGPMPINSLQRLLVVARKQLNLPKATPHTLRHSFATHLAEAGASIHTIMSLLGHKSINTTMVYMHLTHRSEQDSRALVEQLCKELPR